MLRIAIALTIVIVFAFTNSLRADNAATTATTAPTSQPSAVDFRRLKEILPAELNGLHRTDANGQKIKQGDFVMATATGTYQKPNDDSDNAPKVDLTIQDFGANSDMMKGMTAWTALDIDNESDKSFEKTIKVSNFPAYQTFQTEGQSGTVMILVGNRFLVNLQTNHLSADDVKKITDSLPLSNLAALN